jgi:GTP cyclohydrolase I
MAESHAAAAAAASPATGAKPRLVYVTGNADKRAEAHAIAASVGLMLEDGPAPDSLVEIQGTIEEIARAKCLAAYASLSAPVLVEDVSLEFDAFMGLPGPYVRPFLERHALLNIYTAAERASSPGVTAVSALAYTEDGSTVRVFVGRARGIVRDPTPHAHLPAWYPLVGRDPSDVVPDADGLCPAPWAGAPSLHRVRSFAALARTLPLPAPAAKDGDGAVCCGGRHVGRRSAAPAEPNGGADPPSMAVVVAPPSWRALARSRAAKPAATFAPGDVPVGMSAEKMQMIAECSRTILWCLGEDVERQGLLDTPKRMAKALVEMTRGYRMTPKEAIGDALFDHDGEDMVVVRDIDFFSLCEHHLLPFYGKVHVGYMPTGKVIGLSKMPRLVELFAARCQVQERLTTEIARCIMEETGAAGAGVIIEAEHMCMAMRGVKKIGSTTVTKTVLGSMHDDPAANAQFMSFAKLS